MIRAAREPRRRAAKVIGRGEVHGVRGRDGTTTRSPRWLSVDRSGRDVDVSVSSVTFAAGERASLGRRWTAQTTRSSGPRRSRFCPAGIGTAFMFDASAEADRLLVACCTCSHSGRTDKSCPRNRRHLIEHRGRGDPAMDRTTAARDITGLCPGQMISMLPHRSLRYRSPRIEVLVVVAVRGRGFRPTGVAKRGDKEAARWRRVMGSLARARSRACAG